MKLSRRRLLAAMGASAGGVLLPRGLSAAGHTGHKFLFLFCRGGWDTSYVFTPLLDNPAVTVEEGAQLATAGGIPFVHNDTRPSVTAFFEEHASRVCLINGIEIRSVTHERCRQLLLTGSSEGGDDWPSILASNATSPLLTPHIVLAGPSYTARNTSAVVRVGDAGQLPALLDGSALDAASLPVSAPADDIAALTAAFTRARIDEKLAQAPGGQRERFLSGYGDALSRIDGLAEYASRLSLDSEASCRRDNAADAAVVFDLFELGLARCGMIEDNGWCSAGWDTHESNFFQDWHFEELFASLSEILVDLDSRPGEYSERLADEVTIVVLSEMGRHPVLNERGGKEHWTFTSAMLIGAGVAGGQVIGGLDDSGLGRAVDLTAGESTDSGTLLTGSHLGATLLTLGGLSPDDFIHDTLPLTAALR